MVKIFRKSISNYQRKIWMSGLKQDTEFTIVCYV